jgi:hypothetical protein
VAASARLTPALRPRARLALGAGVLALAAAGILAATLAARGPGRSEAPIGAPRASAPVRFHADGFSIAYPPTWTRVPSGDPQVALLVRAPGGGEALLVRMTQLALAVPRVRRAELPVLRALTDRLVHADPGVHLVQPPAEVLIDGVPGWAYAYTEAGPSGGTRLAHVHYFLFAGRTLVALVFQVSRPSRLRTVSPSLATIAASFRTTAG